ncbi:L-fucose/L-arabinose isomerase family protein [Cohnella thermotolerans]|uniref:L-fucose/L-arabinose isomerase family protein n=1 Tax=Cohnella thermotolerans TaxID=329858 RepID=UPI00041C13BD|nr:L-fucose/L-arabinose isomerase family protein [Cohnella thermotolerans]
MKAAEGQQGRGGVSAFEALKPGKKARIGLYSIGLRAYWSQFEGLRERLVEYGKWIERKLADEAEVYNYGLVDTEDEGRAAGEWFNRHNVDLIFCHSATYSTSSTVLPVHQICKAPVVVLNLQPAARINYDKTYTGEWLAHCGACPVPEISNAFNRSGIPFRVVNGLLGLEQTPAISLADEQTSGRPEAKRAWKEIAEWVQAAGVKRTLQHSRFGFLGNTYSGMLDMYSDFTMLQAQTGIHVEVLEMCDLDKLLSEVTEADVQRKLEETRAMFEISEDSPTDPIAKKPTPEQLEWSCRVALAQEKMVRAYNLDSLTYYYHGAPGNAYEKLQSGFILGHSLLTAKGIPCSGEGDLKTALAMKICDLLGKGGSFTEIVVVDYENGTILLGHDGPFHIQIADRKPVLRGMGVYHGKAGTGISVEAKVKTGPVTTLNVTQTVDGKLKLIVSEGESIDGPIMKIGNTMTPVRFHTDPDSYMERWFAEAPTHHCAISVGHNASLYRKVGELLGIEVVVLQP